MNICEMIYRLFDYVNSVTGFIKVVHPTKFYKTLLLDKNDKRVYFRREIFRMIMPMFLQRQWFTTHYQRVTHGPFSKRFEITYE